MCVCGGPVPEPGFPRVSEAMLADRVAFSVSRQRAQAMEKLQGNDLSRRMGLLSGPATGFVRCASASSGASS